MAWASQFIVGIKLKVLTLPYERNNFRALWCRLVIHLFLVSFIFSLLWRCLQCQLYGLPKQRQQNGTRLWCSTELCGRRLSPNASAAHPRSMMVWFLRLALTRALLASFRRPTSLRLFFSHTVAVIHSPIRSMFLSPSLLPVIRATNPLNTHIPSPFESHRHWFFIGLCVFALLLICRFLILVLLFPFLFSLSLYAYLFPVRVCLYTCDTRSVTLLLSNHALTPLSLINNHNMLPFRPDQNLSHLFVHPRPTACIKFSVSIYHGWFWFRVYSCFASFCCTCLVWRGG